MSTTLGRIRLKGRVPSYAHSSNQHLPRHFLRCNSTASGGKSNSSKKEKTPATGSKKEKDDAEHSKGSEKSTTAVLTGREPLYPIYTDVNPLFDTYVKAHHQRTNKKDKHGNIQEYNVSTTVFNDPPLFMIEPRLRPTPRFPTRRYIDPKYRGDGALSSSLESGRNKGETDNEAMERVDRERSMRQSGASVDWGASDSELSEDGRRTGRASGVQYETPLDEALDLQAWNSGDLTNDFEQWDQHATPLEETSSLPSPAEAQTLPPNVVSTLMRFPLISKRVVQQGGKGRMPSWYVLTVAGNGQGLVGVGEGKDTENPRAIEKSFIAACKDLDWVDRFEGRTLWNEIDTKWGSTRILMRPRPMGFGLRCNPFIHQVGLDLPRL